MTIQVDIKGLKRLGKDYIDMMKALSLNIEISAKEALETSDAGFKCFSLGYLACDITNKLEEVEAVALMSIISREKIKFDAMWNSADAEFLVMKARAEQARKDLRSMLGMA
jgi:hypothetical protein